jgi:beta-lactamase class A
MWSRRGALAGGLALAACAPGGRLGAEPKNDPRLAAIEARIGGRVGVFALNTGNGAAMAHRANERFALCSTFKWLLAAQMLRREEAAPGWLQEQVRFGEADLLEYAPVARQHLARGWMSVEEACAAIVVVSDNTAANLLLAANGGPPGLTEFLRANGDRVTRLDRTEPSLNENLPGDARDTTTPVAMVETLQRFLLDDGVLNAASRAKLIGWMVESTTGLERLRAGLPTDWRVGDKTGTWNGAHNAANDVAIAWPTDRAPVIIATYLSDGVLGPAERNAAHAEIARLVVEL